MLGAAVGLWNVGCRIVTSGVAGWRDGRSHSFHKIATGVSALALAILYTASLAAAELTANPPQKTFGPELCGGWQCAQLSPDMSLCRALVPETTPSEGSEIVSFMEQISKGFVRNQCGNPSTGIRVDSLPEGMFFSIFGICDLANILPHHPCERRAIHKDL